VIDQKDSGTTTVPRFEEGQPVTGWRWGGTDWVTGTFVEDFGTDGQAVLVELEDGTRVPVVGETAQPAERGGRHRKPGDELFPTVSGTLPEIGAGRWLA
jgi:hypothetical protein